jgi:copper chaperone CopZ
MQKGDTTTMETTLKVSGMHCTACKMLIEDAISEIKGAKAVSVDHTTGAVTVAYDSNDTLEQIKLAIRGEGFTV